MSNYTWPADTGPTDEQRIHELEEINAELLEALEAMLSAHDARIHIQPAASKARAAIRKAREK